MTGSLEGWFSLLTYSAGIGMKLVEICLSRPNYTVIGSARDDTSPGLAELKSITPAEGSALLLVHIDSASAEDPKKAAAAVEAAGVDHVDIVVANAGGSPLPILPLEEVPMSDLVRDFRTNAAGVLTLFQAFRPLLRRARSPKWASITSAAGSIGLVGQMNSFILTAYATSKAAQNYLTHHVKSVPGNWLAKRIGLDEAPLTPEESATAVLKTIDGATREKVLGKLISAMDGAVLPW
ncbi:NAD(P)-binding Rossmann-fold containing protein [Apiospora rasikravindrae]|uniref:NAD(P)-binding Rossmann-fold containing protein n=1 Tax=Apiospora rasikravindrae TaxID=990691 RepID=A0ABR1TA62_9PEZI